MIAGIGPSMDDRENRSWTFCTVSYSHGEEY